MGCNPIVAYTCSYFSANATASAEVSFCVPTTFMPTPASLARRMTSSLSSLYATKFTWQCASKYFKSILFFAREQVLGFSVRHNRLDYLFTRLRHERFEEKIYCRKFPY